MNILIYNYNEPLPEQGGMERVTDQLARGLAELGYSVTLLCQVKNRHGKEYNPPVPLFFTPKEGKAEYIRKLIKERAIDCVIDQNEGGLIGPYGIFKSREDLKSDTKLIAVQHSNARDGLKNFRASHARKFHGSIVGRLKSFAYNELFLSLKKLNSLRFIRKSFRSQYANYNRIVMLSPQFIDDFKYFCPGADATHLAGIPNSNTYKECEPTLADKKLLFVGRLMNSVKGTDKLLSVWARLEPKFPDWSLDIVGDGVDRTSLEEKAASLGLRNVRFHGQQDPTEFYQHASIFCMTSIYEGFGMVLTESMQHGVVPVAFKSYKAVTDIIDDGKNGILVPPFDEERYADVLAQLMSDAELRKRLASAAVEKSAQFSRDRIIAQWDKLITQCQN